MRKESFLPITPVIHGKMIGIANPFASRQLPKKEFSTGRDTSDVDYYCREYAK
jgi:hypothetical protein